MYKSTSIIIFWILSPLIDPIGGGVALPTSLRKQLILVTLVEWTSQPFLTELFSLTLMCGSHFDIPNFAYAMNLIVRGCSILYQKIQKFVFKKYQTTIRKEQLNLFYAQLCWILFCNK